VVRARACAGIPLLDLQGWPSKRCECWTSSRGIGMTVNWGCCPGGQNSPVAPMLELTGVALDGVLVSMRPFGETCQPYLPLLPQRSYSPVGQRACGDRGRYLRLDGRAGLRPRLQARSEPGLDPLK
jgi:hypothetical protein